MLWFGLLLLAAPVLLWLIGLWGERTMRDTESSGAAGILGPLGDLYHPAGADAQRELDSHKEQRQESGSPRDDDDEPYRLITRPDGSPRALRVRRRGSD